MRHWGVVLSSGTHYLRGVNNNLQPWSTSEGRKQFGLKPANPTEEGLASLHSVLLRKQPYLWRAALLYYTVYHATSMSFSQLFSHIARFVQDPDVRWEYCLRAKRGQTDTSQPGTHTHTHTHTHTPTIYTLLPSDWLRTANFLLHVFFGGIKNELNEL